ncbi:MAG: RHS repeat protein, partial [Asticcacaulis sp.]
MTIPNAFANWASFFDQSLHLARDWDISRVVTVTGPDGVARRFRRQTSGALTPDTGQLYNKIPLTDATLEFLGTWPSDLNDLTLQSTQWRYRDEKSNVWVFQTFKVPDTVRYRIGRPLSVQRPDGTALSFTYDAGGVLASVTDQTGKTLTFNWIVNTVDGVTYPAAVQSIGLPSGYSLRYTYQTAAGAVTTTQPYRLSKVEYLDAASVVQDSTSYGYDNASFPSYVTKILDKNNVVRWKVTYDAQGRATRSEGPNGEFGDTIVYGDISATTFTRTLTDASGRPTIYNFTRGSSDYDAKLMGVDGQATTNCAASSKANTYNAAKQLETATDEEGRVTKFTRNAVGQPTQIIEAFGTAQARTTGITWHSTFNLPTQVVETGLTTSYTYNAAGQVLTVSEVDTTSQTVPYSTNGQTRTTTLTYGTTGGAVGKLISIDGPLSGSGDTTSFTYNANGYLASVTDPAGKTTTVTSWNWRGAPLTVADPNGVSTTFTYDIRGRVLTSTVNPGGSQSQFSYAYDAVGNLTRITLPKGGYLDYTYDTASRLTLIKNEKNEEIVLTPNIAGQVTLQTVKNTSGTIVAQQSMVYDEMGRLIRTLGAASTTSTRLSYDKVSNLKQVTDGRDKVWQTGFDPLDRVIEQTNPETEKVKYAYAANDNLTSHKDGRNLETTRVLNGFGEVIREVSPDRGATTYWYDAAGRLTKTQDADGVETHYSYDNADRLLTRTFTGAPQEAMTFTYDATASGNKGNGRLTGVTEQSGATGYVYDAQGRITKDTKTINGLSYEVQYAYDTNGAITQMTLPSGRVVSLTRDNSGLVTAITTRPTATGTVSNIATAIAYQPFSGLKSLTYGNGLTLTDSYNLNGWLTRIQVKDGATSKFDLSYDYYDDGRLGEIVDNAATGRTVYMSLTDSGRLGYTNGPWGQESYAYDAAGNRIGSYLTVGGVTTSNNEITAGDSNRLGQVQDDGGAVKRHLTYRNGGDLYQDAIPARGRGQRARCRCRRG